MADGSDGADDRSIPGPIESLAGEPADVAPNIARFGLYALAQALLLIFFGLMQWIAARRGLFVPGSPPEVAGRGWPFPHQFLDILGFLGSIPLYPVLGAWAFALWALIPNLPQLVGVVWRRKPSSAAA